MPPRDYGLTRGEKLWAKVESTFQTLVHPVTTDAIRVLAGLSLPLAVEQNVPSEERRATPDVAELIKGKLVPSAWSILTYLKASASAGTVPELAVLLKDLFGTETVNGGVSVTYSPLADIEETSCTLWHLLDDNLLHGLRGCKANRCTIELSGDRPASGRVTLEGFGGASVLAGVTTLNGGIDNIVTSLVVTNSRPFVLGPAAGDQIRIKIDTEAMLVTAIDYSTHTLTVLRAQDGTSAASHSNGATVQPYTPGADASTPDAVLPVMLGSVSLTGTAHRVKSVTVVIDNQLEPRLDEYGEAALTGYVRTGPLQVTGRIRAYSRQQLHQLLSNYKRETVEDVAIIAGSAGTQRVTINLDRVRFLDPPTVDGGGPSFEFEIPFQALASATPGSDTVNIVFD